MSFVAPSLHCQVLPLKLRVLQPPKDNLLQALFSAFRLLNLQDGDILFLSAKVVAIHQGRCLRIDNPKQRSALIKQEADLYIANKLFLEEPSDDKFWDFPFTLKGQTPIPFAGIDESNGADWHILWPENPRQTVEFLHKAIVAECGLSRLGLVITDSTLFPLRRGCLGISIAAASIQLLDSYIGQKDLFGRELKLSENNIVDRLTNFATLFMGEGAEQTPAVVPRGLERFVSKTGETMDFSQLFIEKERDFFGPLFQGFNPTEAI